MRPIFAAAAVAMLSGCPFATVEAELGEMCVTFKDRTISGTPAGESYRHSVIAKPFEVFPKLLEVGMDIESARVSLTVKDGAADLSFLENIQVWVRGVEQGNELPPVSLIDCGDFTCASAQSEPQTSFATDVPGSLGDYLAAGAVQLDITLRGPLPEHDFTVDVEVCVSGGASLALKL